MGKPDWFGSLSYSSYITHYLFVKHHGEVSKMAHCCCGLKILNKWQIVNESVTDTLFRNLGKQMKVKYICD